MENNPQIYCKVKKLLSEQNGQGRNGSNWTKHTIEVETIERYPKRVSIDLFKPEITQKICENDIAIISFEISSREYNGKEYHNVNAFKVEVENPQNGKFYDVTTLTTRAGKSILSKPVVTVAPPPVANNNAFDTEITPANEEPMPF